MIFDPHGNHLALRGMCPVQLAEPRYHMTKGVSCPGGAIGPSSLPWPRAALGRDTRPPGWWRPAQGAAALLAAYSAPPLTVQQASALVHGWRDRHPDIAAAWADHVPPAVPPVPE